MEDVRKRIRQWSRVSYGDPVELRRQMKAASQSGLAERLGRRFEVERASHGRPAAPIRRVV